MKADMEHWTGRLTALAAECGVPGASLAWWSGGELSACATGVLNTATGAAVRTDSLFQIGSITKVWTATQVMLLVEQGRIGLDTAVADVLPGFEVGDRRATDAITLRHLLTHTSGIDGDLFVDTGRGDDCLARYVEACAELEQTFPVGDSHSYCNSGFVIAGRMIEQLTGQVWDQALREQICVPLGLTHTWTLPEDVLRFGAAMGHGDDGKPAPAWGLPRAIGPAGLICATAMDVVAFGRAHLTPGALLADPAALRIPQVDLPNPYDGGRQWGIGWCLDEWDGHEVVSHTGDTIGQHAALWALPGLDTVVAVLVNGGRSAEFQHRVISELLRSLHQLTVPEPLAPPAEPVCVDTAPYTGLYERAGSRIRVTSTPGGLRLRTEPTGILVGLAHPRTLDLIPVDASTFAGRVDGDAMWSAVVFEYRPDGPTYLHYSGRATPKTG
ncbi:serine hydrolase [Streptomyces sp. SID8366]|uniref:serine hydrolase domain-containing protein n=1 Tax=unclassified Streptomyces TaxID=2593676 RepID=UPI000DB9C095|nr:serine hydrolase domain-containing protein [Streptomyces sp. PsTaAH-130]MYU06000.1 serine hydrolase [Streptomyces sp. SID8366]MYU64353.1 serine hydrolase [Streptomyces sp. SID69]RAJ64059.1 CubicO group peptidase (beta-lactamase class C family) [Streptomyces sp. PsTaAH-130]